MYPGHFAAGLALKTFKPDTPTWGLMLGVGLLDWLFGMFVAFGIEGGTIGHLNIPWSHSLLMASVWSVLFACLFWRSGQGVMALMFCAVMSHWVLGLVSHQPDMTLWPHAAAKLGLGAYFGGLAGWCEILISVGATAWYTRSAELAHQTRSAAQAQQYGGRLRVVWCLMAMLYGLEYLAVS